MGVDITHYVIVGIKTTDEKLHSALKLSKDQNVYDFMDESEDVVSSYKAEERDFTYINTDFDYCVLGIIAAKAEEESGEGIDVVDALKVYKKYKSKATEKLKKLGLSTDKISVYIFTYYS